MRRWPFTMGIIFGLSLCTSLTHAQEGAAPGAPPPGPAPTTTQLRALLEKVDDNGRGKASHALVEMKVKTKRYARTMKMESWSKGSERSLIRILEPAKDRGVATLKVDKNLWNYLPNTDRTMRVPSAMMSGAWMGSHFTNDDLVRETRFGDDYTFALAPGADSGAGGVYTIRCTPKPKTPVVWGYVDVKATIEGVPQALDFYSEKGVKVRSFEYSDLKAVGTQTVPMTLVVIPHDKPGERTELRFHSLELDPDLQEDFFSLQALRD